MIESRLEISFDIDIIVTLPCYNVDGQGGCVVDNEWVLNDDIRGVPNKTFKTSKILYFTDISKDKDSQHEFESAFVIAKPKQHVCKMVYWEDNEKKNYYIVGDASTLQKKIDDIEDVVKGMHSYGKFRQIEKEIREEYDKRRIG